MSYTGESSFLRRWRDAFTFGRITKGLQMSEPNPNEIDERVQKGELIVAPAPTAIKLFDDRKTIAVTNFTGDKVAMWRFTALCKSGNARSLQDGVGDEIVVKWYYCHPVQIKGAASGEIVNCVRTVLVTPDNELYESVSDGVASFVQDLRQFFGDAVIDPPLRVKIVRKQTRSKFHTLLLEPVM